MGPTRALGTLDDDRLRETSGIVRSRRHEGVVWGHNDSGGKTRLFAFSTSGEALGTTEIIGATALDWEELSWSPGTDHDWLYIADTGNNALLRTTLRLYRVPEPEPGAASVEAETMRLVFPTGPVNVEAVFVEPDSGVIHVISKDKLAPAVVYRVGPFRPGEVASPMPVASRFFRPGSPKVTSAAMRTDGDWVAVRTYTHLHLFDTRDSVQAGLRNPPCTYLGPPERQGESVDFGLDGLLTVSEGVNATVHLTPLVFP